MLRFHGLVIESDLSHFGQMKIFDVVVYQGSGLSYDRRKMINDGVFIRSCLSFNIIQSNMKRVFDMKVNDRTFVSKSNSTTKLYIIILRRSVFAAMGFNHDLKICSNE